MDVSSFRQLLLSALIALVVCVPVMLLLRPFFRPKSTVIVQEARRAGRVVPARLVSKKDLLYNPQAKYESFRDMRWYGVYEYEVGGRTYHFRGVTRGTTPPPEQIELYYPAGRPKKAIPEGYTKHGVRYTLYGILPLIVWVIVYWLL